MKLNDTDKAILEDYLHIGELYKKGEDIDVDAIDFFSKNIDVFNAKGIDGERYMERVWSTVLKDKDMNLLLMALVAECVGKYRSKTETFIYDERDNNSRD